MTLAKRTIRYGGAMLDQKEIDAVVGVMQAEYGMVVGLKVGESCLVLLTMHFEKVWPTIRSLDFRPLLSPATAPPSAAQPPPPSK